MSPIPDCITCVHFHDSSVEGEWTCAAFPKGIPEDIQSGKQHHDQPVPGDSGIIYERDIDLKRRQALRQEAVAA